MLRLLPFPLLLISLATTGCGGVECAEGTFPSGDNCVGFDPNDDTPPVIAIEPPGRRARDPLPNLVVITTDEPSTVFFTTDGSDPDPETSTAGGTSPIVIGDIVDGMTIKFLAVDRTGNRSEISTATYISDTSPPAPVTNLQVTLGGANGDEATVTWTNPTDADFAGAVLARVVDVVDTDPEPGELLTGPIALSSSLQVLQVGPGTSFLDPGLALGTVRYAVWTHDDLGNYSQAAVVRGERDLGSLALQLSYDTNNDELTFPTIPAALEVSATTSRAGNTVTIDLTINNLANKVFQNPKLEVTALSNASFTNSDGTANGLAFKFFGPNALAPAVPTTRSMIFNVTAGTTATIDLVLAAHPSLIFERNRIDQGQYGFVDMEVLVERPAFLAPGNGNNNRAGRFRPGTLTGERFLDVPTSHAAIERYDLATGSRIGGVVLAQPRGGGNSNRVNIMRLFKTEAGLIAVVKAAGQRNSGNIVLARLNEGLRELERVELPFTFERGIATVAMSPEGVIAIPSSTRVVLFDAKTFRILDADPSTPEDDTIATGLSDRIRSVVFLGPNRIAALARQGGGLVVAEFGSGGITTTMVPGFSGRGHQLAVAPDGRLWIAVDSGLRIYNPETNQVINPGYPQIPGALTFVGDDLLVLRNNRTTIDRVNPANGQITRTVGLTSVTVFQHWLFSTSP